MTFDELKVKARLLPPTPGVYLMIDKAGEIIYVGKAKALKNRVSSYFANLADHTLKTRQLVSRIENFETIFAKTEFDALLLENTLIKKHNPKYNIMLKDDKGYPYLRLPKNPYPRFEVAMRKVDDGARYFGPFGGRGAAFSAIKVMNETFGIPACSKVFPRDIGKERPCLMYHIGRCCGVCSGDVSEEQYEQLITQAGLLLGGSSDKLEKMITGAMQAAAESTQFEKAAMLRDRLYAVKRLRNNRIVVGVGFSECDAVSYSCAGNRACVTVLSYTGGSLMDKNVRFFDGLGDDDASDALESFVKLYYSRIGRAPRELLLSHTIEDRDAIEEYLTNIRGRKCEIIVPQKGEKRKMIEMSLENGALELATLESREQKSMKTLELIAEVLGLAAPPQRIEAYDISNTAGSDAVGSMTVFDGGRPLKKAYRRFKIKVAEGGDDYGSMAEVVGRRVERALSGDSGFLPLPQLMLIDGGAGQVGVALREMTARGADIPVFGMVKDDRHRTRALVAPDGREIGISATPAVFAFVGRVQEETHRFAVEYHQQLRSRAARASQLDEIPGVGEKRRRALMSEFKTVKAMSCADVEALARVVPRNVAEGIYNYFLKKRTENDAGDET